MTNVHLSRRRSITEAEPSANNRIKAPKWWFHSHKPTLKSWTPIQANMKFSSMVTRTMLPMVLMATNTHWTTCCRHTQTKLIRVSRMHPKVLLLPVMVPVVFVFYSITAFLWVILSFLAISMSCSCCVFQSQSCTFNPLALLMALRGLSTLSTLRIFTTEIALDLHKRHNPAVFFLYVSIKQMLSIVLFS